MFCASVIDHCTRPSLPDRIKALVPQVSHLHCSTHTHTHIHTHTHALSLSLSLFYSLTLYLSHTHTQTHSPFTHPFSLTHSLSLSQSLRRFTSWYRWSACRAAHCSHPLGEISMQVRTNAFVQTKRNTTAHMHTCVLSYHVYILFFEKYCRLASFLILFVVCFEISSDLAFFALLSLRWFLKHLCIRQ
jgi:hypothetical protein